MSHLAASFAATNSSAEGPTPLELTIREHWPNLADCLFGVTSAESGSPSLPPCSVILYVEAGALQCCLCPQKRPERGYASLSDVTRHFDGLEDDLGAGRFQWRIPRNKRTS